MVSAPKSARMLLSKGQIKPKADWRAVDSPKKQTNKFVFVTLKSKKVKKTSSFVHFWENLRRINLLTALSDL